MRRPPPTRPGTAPRKKNPPVRKPYQRRYGNRTKGAKTPVRKPYHKQTSKTVPLSIFRREGPPAPGAWTHARPVAGNDVLPLALPTGWGAVVRALGPGQIRLCFGEAPAKGWLPIPSALAYRCRHSVELSTPDRHRGASAQCSALLECPTCRSRAADGRRLHLATRPMI